MSVPQATAPPSEDETPLSFEDVVQAFLNAFPTPTDQQLHAFAELLGIKYEEFEERVFEMFSDVLEDEEVEDLIDDEDIVTDDLDLFLVAFFAYVPSATEEQVHKLAEVLDITAEELEERVYRMLAEFVDSEDEDTTEIPN